VNCFVKDPTWDIKIADQRQCDGAGSLGDSLVGVGISFDDRYYGQVRFICHDSNFAESSTILNYGESYKNGDITCTSKKEGIQCSNKNGGSFTIGQSVYPLDTVENNRTFTTPSKKIICTGDISVQCKYRFNNLNPGWDLCTGLGGVGEDIILNKHGHIASSNKCVLENEFAKIGDYPVLGEGESINFRQISCSLNNSILTCKHDNGGQMKFDEKKSVRL